MDEFLRVLEEQFALPELHLREYSPLTLAYIGDAAYEIVIRTIVVRQGNAPVNKLHRRASSLVKAEKQSQMAGVLKPHFTEEEADIYRRGKNAKSPTRAKNASLADYRRATGFEAVMGYLYLQGRTERMIELVRIALDIINLENQRNG